MLFDKSLGSSDLLVIMLALSHKYGEVCLAYIIYFNGEPLADGLKARNRLARLENSFGEVHC